MATIKEQTEKTERLKTSLDNKVDSIGNIINTKVKEKPTTLTQVEDVLSRKMLGVGDILPMGTWVLDDNFEVHWEKPNSVTANKHNGIKRRGKFLYVLKNPTEITKLDLDGNLLKTYTINANYFPCFCVDDNTLYIAFTDSRGHNYVDALNINTGEIVWRFTYNYNIENIAQNTTHIFIATKDYKIVKIDKAGGNKEWAKEVTNAGNWQTLYADDTGVYYCNQKGIAGGISVDTGANLWKKTIGERVTGFAPLENTLICTNYDGRVYCINRFTGATIWRTGAYATPSNRTEATFNPLVGIDNNIYFIFNYNTIYRLTPEGNTKIYKITDYTDIWGMALTENNKDIIFNSSTNLIKKKNPTMCPIILDVVDKKLKL